MASATANCAKMVEYALHNGYDHVVGMQMGPQTGDARAFTDFEQLFDAWTKQMQWLLSLLVRTVNLGRYKDPEFYGRPFLSGITERAVERGIDAVNPEGERGNCWITGFTWVENADSLAAVKKLVFDDKKYTMDQLITALESNWDGCEQMRLDFVNKAPKWGNDDDYVDDIMLRCLRTLAKHSRVMRCPSNNTWPISPQNVSGNIHYSSVVGALPNGRRLGDALYDGGISPGPGLDKKGPTAVLKSCGKIDHVGGRQGLPAEPAPVPHPDGGGKRLSTLARLHAHLGRPGPGPHPVQHGLGQNPPGRPEGPGKIPGSNRAGGRIQRPLCGHFPQDPG